MGILVIRGTAKGHGMGLLNNRDDKTKTSPKKDKHGLKKSELSDVTGGLARSNTRIRARSNDGHHNPPR